MNGLANVMVAVGILLLLLERRRGPNHMVAARAPEE